MKDILKLDNGPMHTPMNLLHCEWIKGHDNCSKLIFVRDEARFLFVNFWHKMPKLAKPFIFSSHAIQVFYFDDIKKDGWKVVLHSEASARREVVDRQMHG